MQNLSKLYCLEISWGSIYFVDGQTYGDQDIPQYLSHLVSGPKDLN